MFFGILCFFDFCVFLITQKSFWNVLLGEKSYWNVFQCHYCKCEKGQIHCRHKSHHAYASGFGGTNHLSTCLLSMKINFYHQQFNSIYLFVKWIYKWIWWDQSSFYMFISIKANIYHLKGSELYWPWTFREDLLLWQHGRWEKWILCKKKIKITHPLKISGEYCHCDYCRCKHGYGLSKVHRGQCLF